MEIIPPNTDANPLTVLANILTHWMFIIKLETIFSMSLWYLTENIAIIVNNKISIKFSWSVLNKKSLIRNLTIYYNNHISILYLKIFFSA